MFHRLTLSFPLTLSLAAMLTLSAVAQQQSDTQDKSLDVRSSVGDLHVGKDGDAHNAGLPLYPGAHPKRDENNDPLNFGVATEGFGLKLVVAKYESDDAPAKVVDFYREKLKKFGKVLECHSQKHGGDVDVNSDDNDSRKTGSKDSKGKNQESKQLKCDSDGGQARQRNDRHGYASDVR